MQMFTDTSYHFVCQVEKDVPHVFLVYDDKDRKYKVAKRAYVETASLKVPATVHNEAVTLSEMSGKEGFLEFYEILRVKQTKIVYIIMEYAEYGDVYNYLVNYPLISRCSSAPDVSGMLPGSPSSHASAARKEEEQKEVRASSDSERGKRDRLPRLPRLPRLTKKKKKKKKKHKKDKKDKKDKRSQKCGSDDSTDTSNYNLSLDLDDVEGDDDVPSPTSNKTSAASSGRKSVENVHELPGSESSGSQLLPNSPRTEAGLPENIALAVFLKMVKCVKTLHAEGLAHCDIKLENFFLHKSPFDVRLADFQYTIPHKEGFHCEHSRGTMHYAAPEIVSGKAFDPQKADVWSLGVCLYSMIYGASPFFGSTLERIRAKIIHQKLTLMDDFVDDLLRKMLTKNPLQRATLEDVEIHPWTLGRPARHAPLPLHKSHHYEMESFEECHPALFE